MEKQEKLIMEEAPPDTSTYEEGSAEAITKKPREGKQGSFSFFDAMKEAGLNE